jgi:hypothetical protein
MAVFIYYYQYNLYMYDLCMFIRYLVSITQVLKIIWADNCYECGNLLFDIIIPYHHHQPINIPTAEAQALLRT